MFPARAVSCVLAPMSSTNKVWRKFTEWIVRALFINVTGMQSEKTCPNSPEANPEGMQASKLKPTCRQDTKEGWTTWARRPKRQTNTVLGQVKMIGGSILQTTAGQGGNGRI